jgi:hypothetical protein
MRKHPRDYEFRDDYCKSPPITGYKRLISPLTQFFVGTVSVEKLRFLFSPMPVKSYSYLLISRRIFFIENEKRGAGPLIGAVAYFNRRSRESTERRMSVIKFRGEA